MPAAALVLFARISRQTYARCRDQRRSCCYLIIRRTTIAPMALNEQPVTCGVCGGEARQFSPEPAPDTEPPDFDTRPQGAAVETWIAQCPHCGYCAEDLVTAQLGTQDVVSSPEYQARLADSRFPAAARRFAC